MSAPPHSREAAEDRPATTSTALVVEDAAKSFGTVEALKGVSLTLDVGEFVVLLGPNGAGKSTLFSLMTGLVRPNRGRILIDGHDVIRDAAPALADLGVVFQQPTLDLELSVEANLRFHARLHGMDRRRARRRIGEELERLGLAGVANLKARTLSGGNRRRVELARALLHEPRLLLMDEPTVGLDPASRRDLLAHVLTLRGERRIGVLWATHLVDEAEAADRVVVLDHGRVLRDATPAELVREFEAATLGEAFLGLTG